jgi:hypothetical protein
MIVPLYMRAFIPNQFKNVLLEVVDTFGPGLAVMLAFFFSRRAAAATGSPDSRPAVIRNFHFGFQHGTSIHPFRLPAIPRGRFWSVLVLRDPSSSPHGAVLTGPKNSKSGKLRLFSA